MEDALLREIRQFLTETGMGAHYFGKLASNNSELVVRLERGKTITLRTAVNVKQFMARYRRSQRGLARRVAAE
jgi:hypothetical protein